MGTVADLEKRNREKALDRSNKRNRELAYVRELSMQVAILQHTLAELQEELRSKL